MDHADDSSKRSACPRNKSLIPIMDMVKVVANDEFAACFHEVSAEPGHDHDGRREEQSRSGRCYKKGDRALR